MTSTRPQAPTGSRLPVAVVGCGAMATRYHLPALARRDDVEVRALVDPERERALDLAGRYGAMHVLADHRDLEATGARAVILTVPNHLHEPIATDLLDLGMHVLIEKPLAPTVAACKAIQAAAEESGAIAATALPFRFSGVARLTHRVVATGVLGAIEEITAEYGTTATWRAATDHLLRHDLSGGGVLLDLGSHVLDLLVWWLGDLAVASYRDRVAHARGVEADAEVGLRPTWGPAEGVPVRVDLSRTRDLAQRIVLRGEHGTLEVDLGSQVVRLRDAAGTVVLEGLAGPRRNLADLVAAAQDDFVGAVTTGRPPAVPAEEAARSVALIETCYAHRQPLVLPWEAGGPARAASAGPPPGTPVLVTGATDFVGGRVVDKLVEAGCEVRALVRDASTAARLAELPVEIHHGAITDPAAVRAAVRGCDVVMHAAHDVSTPRRNRATGIDGTRLVAEACLAAGVGRLVHLSSFAVYGTTPPGDLTEASAYNPPASAYARAKLAGERVVLDLHRERGLPVAILQPTIVYGPWGKVWTAGCVAELRAGLIPLVDGGGGLCNAVYVDDAADAVLLAATAPGVEGRTLLVSGAEPITWARFYRGFEDALDLAATIDVPSAVLPALARRQRQAARREVARAAITAVRQRSVDRGLVDAVRRLPLAQRGVALLRDTLPESSWEAIKDRVYGDPMRPAAPTGPDAGEVAGQAAVAGEAASVTPPARPRTSRPRVHVPPAGRLELYRSRTRVRIDRAADLLGYAPRFDFDRGMDATGAFLRWARL